MSYQINQPTFVPGEGVKLTWTYPSVFKPILGTTILYLQRSTTKTNWRLQPYFNVKLAASVDPTPVAETGWDTIKTWTIPGFLLGGVLPTSYTDSATPNPTFNYRLVAFIWPGNVNKYYEIEWAAATISQIGPGRCTFLRYVGGTNATTSSMTLDRLKVAPDGSIVVAGFIYGVANPGTTNSAQYLTSQGAQDMMIAKYSAAGVLQWAKRFGDVQPDQIYDIAIDASGNIYFTGQTSAGSGGNYDFGFGSVDTTAGRSSVVVLKMNSSGTILWHKYFDGTGNDKGIGIGIDPTNTYVYVCGTFGFFGTTINFGGGDLPLNGRPSAFLAKLSVVDGSHVWSIAAGQGQNESYFNNIRFTSTGDLIIGVEFRGTTDLGDGTLTASSGSFNAALVKYSKVDGSFMWKRAILCTGTSKNYSMAIDPVDDGIWVTGSVQTGTVTFSPGVTELENVAGGFYIVKYSALGVYVRHRYFSSGDNPMSAFAIKCDVLRDVIIGGEAVDQINFGDGWLFAQGGGDAFLAKFDQNLVIKWTRRGEPQGTNTRCIDLDANNEIIISGGCGPVDHVSGFARRPTEFAPQVIDPPLSSIMEPGMATTGFWARFTK